MKVICNINIQCMDYESGNFGTFLTDLNGVKISPTYKSFYELIINIRKLLPDFNVNKQYKGEYTPL